MSKEYCMNSYRKFFFLNTAFFLHLYEKDKPRVWAFYSSISFCVYLKKSVLLNNNHQSTRLNIQSMIDDGPQTEWGVTHSLHCILSAKA